MTATTYFDAPTPRQSRGFFASLFAAVVEIFTPSAPTRRPMRKYAAEEDLPPWLQRNKADADWTCKPQPLSDFEPKPEPAAATAPIVNLDSLAEVLKKNPIAELKRHLRELTYGEFIEAAAGLGFDPQTAWKWATEESNVVPMRMAA